MITTNFSECLNTALMQSGKSLGQLQSELLAKGYRINKSTLNRWCNGLSMPRRDKLALLRHLPDVLEMRPALRSVFNRLVSQLVGGPFFGGTLSGGSFGGGEVAGGLFSRHNYLGGPVVFFTGRTPELTRLKEAVRKRQTVLITGLGGVGKTSLARKLLEEVSPEFAYGSDAISISADQSPIAVLEQVARRLGIPFSSVAVGQDWALAIREIRGWIDTLDIIFLLDDVQESSQIRQLVAELTDITWVITSRRKLFLPFDVVEVGLVPPPIEDAISMLMHYSGRSNNFQRLAAARQIVTRLGSLPIAIRGAGGLVKTGRLANLPALLQWLAKQGLAGVRLEDWELADFLAGLLAMVADDGRDLFALCGVFPNGRISKPVFDALALELGLPLDNIGELANLSLLDWSLQYDRFELHPLIHEYARDYLERHPHREALQLAFAAYYTTFARENHDNEPAIEYELPMLISAARIVCDRYNWRLLQPLWQVISSALWRMSDWSAYRRFDEKCLKVAQLSGDRHVESRILSELGWVLLEEGQWEAADEYFREAQFIVDDLTSTEQSVRLRRYRAILFTERGELTKAAVLLAEAQHLVERTSEMAGWSKKSRERSLALIYHAYAGLARAAADYEAALEQELQAIAASEQTDLHHFRPMFDLQLGDIYYLRRAVDKAGQVWQEIIRHGAKYQPEKRIIAAAFLRMAQLAAYRGNRERALGWAYRAEALFRASGLIEKARQAGELTQGLEVLMLEAPDVWPVFELWD